MKHQFNFRTTDELKEKYSENSSLKNMKMSYSYRVQQIIFIENQLSGFYFKITLTGNKYY